MEAMRSRILSALILPGLLAFSSVLPAKAPAARQYLLYVGTYSGPESKGIYAWRFDAGTGKTVPLGLAAESANPSFLALSPGGQFLYAVNELGEYQGQKSGAVSAFAIDRSTGKLAKLNEVPSGGAHPCYISVDGPGRNALVANYTGGSVAVFPIRANGGLGSASCFIQFSGKGVDPARQEAPHAHSIDFAPGGRFVLAADLGLDKLLVYRFDQGTLLPNGIPFARTNPGAGPRHFAFHPDGKFVYVLSEMQCGVTTFEWDAERGALLELQAISTLPADFKGVNTCAEIHVHPGGKFLYASNRGHDSIAVFAIDDRKGTLSLVEHVPTGGHTPRDFALDPSGKWLFAENQDSGSVVIFNVDGTTGRLTPSGESLKVPSPVCLKFLPLD